MSDDIAISVQGVSKAYRIWESPAGRLTSPILQKAAGMFPPGSSLAQSLQTRAAKNYRDFWALKDISFEVKIGESVGIIGRNGSGKSTILQIIAGTLQPTSGTVKVNGRVAALLELGSGFNPEFTGRENVYLTGAVLGFTRTQIDARFDAIAAFAEIGDFIEQPVKTYSSGMMVRLAFAVQTAVDPDILIIDEALSVGDFFFQQKCAARMRALRARGTTLLFVSHEMGSVRDLCHRAVYLCQGQQIAFGESQDVISLYLREESDPTAVALKATAPAALAAATNLHKTVRDGALWINPSFGPGLPPAGGTEILAVRLLDSQHRPIVSLTMGQRALMQVFVLARETNPLHVAVELKNRHGQVVTSISSRTSRLAPVVAAPGQIVEFEADIEFSLEAGEYSLQAVAGRPDRRPNIGTRIHATPWLGPLALRWNYEEEEAPFLGMFHVPARVRLAVMSNPPTT